jgi:hypothetical protein
MPRWLDLSSIDLPDLPLVDCFGNAPLERILPLLSRVGLAEAWSYLRAPAQLSEGQRWRLKLALSLHQATGSHGARQSPGAGASSTATRPADAASHGATGLGAAGSHGATASHGATGSQEIASLHGPQRSEDAPAGREGRAARAAPDPRCEQKTAVIACDEFAALLDRVTARIVARALRRAIDASRACSAILVTSHEDLSKALRPDVLVRCDFGHICITQPTIEGGAP